MAAPLLAGEIDAGLEQVFARTAQGEVVSALVFMIDQGDVDVLVAEHRAGRVPFARRNEEVVRLLRDTASLTQADLLADLAVRNATGEVGQFESFWIANVIRIDATEDVLRDIARRPDVKRVYFNMPITSISPVDDDNARRRRAVDDRHEANPMPIGSVEPGVAAVKAPQVWNMGYTGHGVLIATMDSGVDGNHPALASQWRGLDSRYAGNPQWAWFDPITNTQFPTEFASNSHGTHTLGTVLGSAPGNQIGVAPGVQWIHAGVIDRGGINATISNAILSFQWMASPTGNPADTWAVPRVASNSWGTVAAFGHPECDQTFWQWIDNSEAAGTIQLFAAGNEGTGGLRRPADRATTEYQSLAVAAVNPHQASWPAAGFSSRGPTFCTPNASPAIKPDIAAPGVNIRSAISGGGYASQDGTSMAVPHINGVVALMLEACDLLTGDEVKQIIYDTAFDLGTAGKDNTFGWGMVDAYEAVNEALAQCAIGIRLPSGAPSMLQPGEQASFAVEVIEGSESVVPGSETLYYRFGGGPFQSAMLEPNGNGLYTATLPPALCNQQLQFYVQIEGTGGSVRTMPLNAPQNYYSALVGEFANVEIYHQDFSSGMPAGWTMTGIWNLSSACPVSSTCAGSQWAYYGQPATCNYATGGTNSGQMLSAPIALPAVSLGGSINVSFCYTLQTEPSPEYDQARFSVLGGPTTLLTDSAAQWTTFSSNLTAYAGQTVTLRWHFDTFDASFNNFRGWQVNNIRITVTTLQCEDPAPLCPSDLNNDGVVDVSDLLVLFANWGPCGVCSSDINSDGVVDVSDLLLLLGSWGACD